MHRIRPRKCSLSVLLFICLGILLLGLVGYALFFPREYGHMDITVVDAIPSSPWKGRCWYSRMRAYLLPRTRWAGPRFSACPSSGTANRTGFYTNPTGNAPCWYTRQAISPTPCFMSK